MKIAVEAEDLALLVEAVAHGYFGRIPTGAHQGAMMRLIAAYHAGIVEARWPGSTALVQPEEVTPASQQTNVQGAGRAPATAAQPPAEVAHYAGCACHEDRRDAKIAGALRVLGDYYDGPETPGGSPITIAMGILDGALAPGGLPWGWARSKASPPASPPASDEADEDPPGSEP